MVPARIPECGFVAALLPFGLATAAVADAPPLAAGFAAVFVIAVLVGAVALEAVPAAVGLAVGLDAAAILVPPVPVLAPKV